MRAIEKIATDLLAESRSHPMQDRTAMEQAFCAAVDLLLADIKMLQAWIEDIQSGMYVNCIYCGHRYGPMSTTPVAIADALKAHVSQCQSHPMAALVRALKSASAQCGNVVHNCEQHPVDNDRHLASWRDVKEFIDASLSQAIGK